MILIYLFMCAAQERIEPLSCCAGAYTLPWVNSATTIIVLPNATFLLYISSSMPSKPSTNSSAQVSTSRHGQWFETSPRQTTREQASLDDRNDNILYNKVGNSSPMVKLHDNVTTSTLQSLAISDSCVFLAQPRTSTLPNKNSYSGYPSVISNVSRFVDPRDVTS